MSRDPTIQSFLGSIQDVYPFHMPGHKRNPAFVGAYAAADITEIHGADNLQNPGGILRGLQNKLAALYGADESMILVNGATAGIEAALLYCGQKRLLLARNSHRSAYGGLILSGASADFVYPEIDAHGIATCVPPQAVEAALVATATGDAVFVTSPTYEGYCSDIEAIAAMAHRHGMLLIVDEAHGAHLGFHPGFPKSAVQCGADIVVQSLHKTLPVPGQCAVLHVTGPRVDTNRLRQCVNLLQTSSPSYFFMSEIETCANLLLNDGDRLFAEYYDRLRRFRDGFDCAHIRLLTADGLDPGKLTFCLEGLGIGSGVETLSGEAFMARLRERGLELEMCGPTHAVAMTSIADTDEGFARLGAAVKAMDGLCSPNAGLPPVPSIPPMPVRRLSIRDAFLGEKRAVALDDAENAVAGDFVIPYPPGIPLVVPGEVLTRDVIGEIRRLRESGVGFASDMVTILSDY